MDQAGRFVADAVLGIDTLWGGDVMCASGTGRFIADSWFSDEPLPQAYTVSSADPVRKSGGVSAKRIDHDAIAQYLRDIAYALHNWYNAHQFIVDDADLRDARIALAMATRQVIANGLDLLGVSAPEKM